MLLILLFILIVYSVFFFLFSYSAADFNILNKLQALFVTVLSAFLLFLVLSLILDFSKFESKQIYKIIVIIFTVCFAAVSITEIFYSVHTLISTIVSAVILFFGLIFSFKFINIKEIYQDKNSRIIFYIFILSVFTIPLEILEIYLRKSMLENISYLPQGMVTYALFFFVCSLINSIYNLKLISVSYSSNYKELSSIPKAFILNYSISIREQEICTLLLQAKSHKEIAYILKISPRTVGRHVYNLYKKTEVNSLIELINLLKK